MIYINKMISDFPEMISDFPEVIPNPLINNSILNIEEYFNNTTIDPIKTCKNNLNIYNLKRKHNHIFVLSKLNDTCSLSEEIHTNEFWNKGNMNEAIEKLVIYKIDIEVLKNKSHFNNILFLEYKILSIFNKFGFELEEYEIVLPITNIWFYHINNYLDLFKENNLDNLIKIMKINDYFGLIKNIRFDNNLENIIANLSEGLYWTETKKTNITAGGTYKDRRFQLDIKKYQKKKKIFLTK